MLKILMIALAVLSFNSFAGDHWDGCSSAAAGVRLQNGTLYLRGKELKTPVTVLSSSVVDQEERKCQDVVVFENTVTLEQISFEGPYGSVKTFVLCERGGEVHSPYCL